MKNDLPPTSSQLRAFGSTRSHVLAQYEPQKRTERKGQGRRKRQPCSSFNFTTFSLKRKPRSSLSTMSLLSLLFCLITSGATLFFRFKALGPCHLRCTAKEKGERLERGKDQRTIGRLVRERQEILEPAKRRKLTSIALLRRSRPSPLTC